MKALAIVLLLLTVGCQVVRPGRYETQCRLHGYPWVVLVLRPDHSFQYEFALTSIQVEGVWGQKADTLILQSPQFIQDSAGYHPMIKFDPSNDSTDELLFKRGKLYPLIKRDRCYLRRIGR